MCHDVVSSTNDSRTLAAPVCAGKYTPTHETSHTHRDLSLYGGLRQSTQVLVTTSQMSCSTVLTTQEKNTAGAPMTCHCTRTSDLLLESTSARQQRTHRPCPHGKQPRYCDPLSSLKKHLPAGKAFSSTLGTRWQLLCVRVFCAQLLLAGARGQAGSDKERHGARAKETGCLHHRGHQDNP